MPTDLPARSAARTSRAEAVESISALMLFYLIWTLAALVFFTGESRLGMFKGMTTAEAVLQATMPVSTLERGGMDWTPTGP
jgi:hypothetical protein